MVSCSIWFIAPIIMLLTPALCRADRNLNHLGYTLTWHDDFDATNLDATKWTISTSFNNANNELEHYVTNDVYVTNGHLVLESDAIVANGQTNYTSGKVTGYNKFNQLYGWFEWNGQIPNGQGIWPAYWMLNYVTWPPEIDVMETIGTESYCNTMSLHWGPLPAGCTQPENCGHTENLQYCSGTDYSAGFHTYAVDWEPGGCSYYIDGVRRYVAGYLGNCTNTMYLIMNTAVGGNWPGSPNSTTPFPCYNLIDYVHVYTPIFGRYPLSNSGFENGASVYDFNDWNTYGKENIQSDPIVANARSGNRAVQIWGQYTGQVNSSGIYQDLWAFGGETWQASVWARNRPNDIPQGGNLASLKLEFWDNAGNLLAHTVQTILTNTSPTNYNQYMVSGVAPFATSRARLVMEYTQTNNGGGSVNFDDASLGLLLPAPNGLTNGGFEGGLAGWASYGAGFTNYGVNTDTTIALSGTNYFKVYGQFTSANNFSGVYQDNPCAPGATYTADGGGYTLSSDEIAAGNNAWIEVTFRDANTNILALYRSAILDSTMPANAWVELPVTNQYDPATLAVTGTVSRLVAPAGSAFVRYQVIFYQPSSNPAGSVYFDQLSLSQPGVTPAAAPVITTVSPNGSVPFLSAASTFAFTVSSPTAMNSSAVKVWLNGLDVSPLLLVGGTSNILSVTLPGIAPNFVYSISVTATNATGSTTTNLTFDTFNQADFIIEAEDFDFSRGQFIDAPQPSSVNSANSYFGKVGVNLIDEDFITYAGSHLFRPADDIATEVTSDFLRQTYYLAQQTNSAVADYDVGWWYAGAWLNYTRTVPTNNYNIYGRLAGGSGSYSVKCEQVISGRGTTFQTTQYLGALSAAGLGWQTWGWAPLLTSNGQPAVVSLGGINTLRMTSSGNVNANFYILVPAPPPVNLQAAMTAAGPQLTVPTQTGFSYLVLYKNNLTDPSWKVLYIMTGDGTLQSLTDPTGGSQRFYSVMTL